MLGPGVLLLADRGLVSFDLWRARRTGAALVWRTRTNAVLPVVEALADGSYLSELVAARDHTTAATRPGCGWWSTPWAGTGAVAASRPLPAGDLDPGSRQAPAPELAALYQQRWEFETALDELKTHQRGPGVVLRSKSPAVVAREVWAMLLVHHAIRRLMHRAALAVDVDPDRPSFTRSLRIVRRQATTAGQATFPP